jgi:hypothetical protein
LCAFYDPLSLVVVFSRRLFMVMLFWLCLVRFLLYLRLKVSDLTLKSDYTPKRKKEKHMEQDGWLDSLNSIDHVLMSKSKHVAGSVSRLGQPMDTRAETVA